MRNNRLTNILVAVKATLADIALDAAKAFEAEWSSFVELQEIKAKPVAQLDLSRCCAQEPWVCDSLGLKPWEMENVVYYVSVDNSYALSIGLSHWDRLFRASARDMLARNPSAGALLANGFYRVNAAGLDLLRTLARGSSASLRIEKRIFLTFEACGKASKAHLSLALPCCLTGGKAPHGWVKTVELPRVKMRSSSGAEYTWRSERVDQTRSRASKASAKARRAGRALKALR